MSRSSERASSIQSVNKHSTGARTYSSPERAIAKVTAVFPETKTEESTSFAPYGCALVLSLSPVHTSQYPLPTYPPAEPERQPTTPAGRNWRDLGVSTEECAEDSGDDSEEDSGQDSGKVFGKDSAEESSDSDDNDEKRRMLAAAKPSATRSKL